MPRFSYFLGALVVSGALMTHPAVARNGGYWNEGGHSSSRWSEKNHSKEYGSKSRHRQNYNYDRKERSHGSIKNRPWKKSEYKAHNGKRQRKPDRHYKGQMYNWPAQRQKGAYHASQKHSYYKPTYKSYRYKHYYRPKYIYAKPHYGHWYYGYYPYRGFYWPFAHVTFVINLTAPEIELHHQAIYAALDAPVGQVITWSRTGRFGTIVGLRTGYDEYGNLCKQYRQTIQFHGRVTSELSVSCLTPEGYWVSP